MISILSKSMIFRIALILAGLLTFPPETRSQISGTQSDERAVRILDTRADFSGWQADDGSGLPENEIRIGFFMPQNVNRSVADAADMAIHDLNTSGGYNGLPFRLISRWAVNPWSAGSREMIRLIYQDSVCVIIGSVDGTATHIAEQIVTKARVTLIAPLSSDPTLNYINIPWMFRLPPDNNVQSQVIVGQGIKAHDLSRIGLITSNDHDGKVFTEDMLDILAQNDLNPKFHFEIPPLTADPEEIAERIREYRTDGLIISLSAPDLKRFLPVIGRQYPGISVFIPWIPQLEPMEIADQINIPTYYIDPVNPAATQFSKDFADRFEARYGYAPSTSAAYTYDAVNLAGMAVKNAGPNRARIRESVAGISGYIGVSGKIDWDNGGGNQTVPVFHRLSVIK